LGGRPVRVLSREARRRSAEGPALARSVGPESVSAVWEIGLEKCLPAADFALLLSGNFPIRHLSHKQDFSEKALAERTRKAYRRAWADFLKYCEAVGKDPLPARPVTVAAYITESIMGV
jgi:hypothetical protein